MVVIGILFFFVIIGVSGLGCAFTGILLFIIRAGAVSPAFHGKGTNA
jgi:predicted transporter